MSSGGNNRLGWRTDSDLGGGYLAESVKMLKDLASIIEKRDIHPIVEKEFAWKEAQKAFDSMMKQTTFEKIVIEV